MIGLLAIAFLILACIANLAHYYDAAMVWAVLFGICVYDGNQRKKK